MARSGVIMYLSPSALEIGVRSGRHVRKVERTDLDPADWADLWARQLRALDAPLAQLAQRVGVRRGASVDVVYQSPDTRIEVLTVQVPARDAVAAAQMSLAQGGADRSDRPTRAHVLFSETAATPVRTHVLCAGDSEATLDSITEWLARAGFVPGALVSSEAVEVLGLAERFRTRASGAEASLMLVGEHRTVIASGEGASLRCVRTLDFGYGAMIDAMARAARAADAKSLSPGAVRQWAREALFRVGVPRRDQVVDEGLDVRAEHVLPLLQPVLQRYAVEVKQTLRFALGEAGLVRGSLLLSGPGASIPSLAPVLSTQIDIAVTLDAQGDQSPLVAAAGAELFCLSLLPVSEQRRRDGVAYKRMMLVGAGAAAVLIAADAASTLREKYQVQRLTDGQMAQLIEVRRDVELRRQAAELALRVEAQEEAARASVGARPEWAALLDELGVLSAGNIRLTDVGANAVGAAYSATISGVADMPDRTSGAPDPLAAYIERLQRSPMIESVELGSTRLGEYEGTPVKHFTITAKLVSMPARLAGAEDTP